MDEVKHARPTTASSTRAPEIDIDTLRGFKDGVVKKLTGGLAGMAKARKVEVVHRRRQLPRSAPRRGGRRAAAAKKVVKFAKAIIAAGSQAVKLPFMPEDERVVDSTGALLLKSIPKRMLVVGGGIIGLEMATVYSTLGTRIDVVEMLDGLMQGADRDLVKVWEKFNATRFDNVMLKTKTVGAKATKAGIEVSFEGEKAPAGAAGLRPGAGGGRAAAPTARRSAPTRPASPSPIAASSTSTGRCAPTCRTSSPSATSSASRCSRTRRCTRRMWRPRRRTARRRSSMRAQIPSVAYTDPEVAWAGKTEEQCKAEGIKIGKAVFPWAASGRAIANGRDEGFTKLLFDEATHRVIGGGIVGTHAGDLISEVCLAIEMGCEPADIGKTIHPHPTLGESIGMAAEVFEGHCTDLPPQKKK